MKTFGLGKSHKLCSKVAVDHLFATRDSGNTLLAFPLRAVWAENAGRATGEKVQFLITVPKKRLRHAVDRVTMRRRIREAYRLARPAFAHARQDAPALDIAFIYVANTLEPYARVEKAMHRILTKLAAHQPTIESAPPTIENSPC